jgi:hypothetical protein
MGLLEHQANGNGAYPCAGARDACMQQEQQEAVSAAVSSSLASSRPGERETEQLHAARPVERKAELHASFDAIVAPLEAAAGKRLNGSGRTACLAAFDESPEGFERIAGKALERAQVNPLGLLIKMVRDGDHLEESRPATPREPPARRKSSRCSCGFVPLEKDERLVIVTKNVGKALSERDGTCGVCEKPVRPGAKGTIGQLGRLRDDPWFEITWSHAECLKERSRDSTACGLPVVRRRRRPPRRRLRARARFPKPRGSGLAQR